MVVVVGEVVTGGGVGAGVDTGAAVTVRVVVAVSSRPTSGSTMLAVTVSVPTGAAVEGI